LLTDGVDQHPHCVLLLDEIEKAHPDLFNVLLQIMDHGKLTDHNGKQVSFRNVILIMTTNAGAADLAKEAYGFTRTKRTGDDVEAINRMFAPEFRNRLDATITFNHLSEEVIAKVVEKFVLQLEAQLADRDVTIELTEDASKWLIAHGYDEQMGARPMARLIQEHIKKPLADEVLFGKLKTGGHVRVVVAKDEADGDKLGFEYVEGPVTPKPEKLPEPNRAKPKRRTSMKRSKPAASKGEGDAARRGSVPKVPLKV
jgi:ATP-dependent Clp protease ATP-binding subunit ClpA